MNNPYTLPDGEPALPENQPARAGRRPAPALLMVDTNSGDASTHSFFRVQDASRSRYNALTVRAEQGMSLRFTEESGAEIYVPHHAISSIVYSPGDLGD